MITSTLIQSIPQTPAQQKFVQSGAQSAFTPVLQRPIAVRQSPINIFEPSPIQKFLYFNALRQQHHQYQQQQQTQLFLQQNPSVPTIIPMNLFTISPQKPQSKVTPTEFLKQIGNLNNATPSNLVRSESLPQIQQHNQLIVNGPKGFSYEVIMPKQSLLSSNPLSDGMNTDGSADLDKDMESTDLSQQSSSNNRAKNEMKGNTQQNLTEKSKNKQGKTNYLEINGIVIDKILSSDDLNECVDFILKKEKSENKKDSKGTLRVIRHNSSSKSKEKKSRQRKNLDQHAILSEQFLQNPNWDKNTIQTLSDTLGLKESQIYKWNWDMRKKSGLNNPTQQQ